MPHIHKDIDFTISVFVVRDGRVLLHTHRKYGMLLPPGGHIELDEDPNQAALREVKEECGLEVALIAPRSAPQFDEKGFVHLIAPFYFNIHEAAPGHRHADFTYFATSPAGDIVPEYETDGWRWLAREEIEAAPAEVMWPSVRFYALAAIAEAAKRLQ
jgi:8-oxo-dGTP pyrophosphatase MutT (NUDIX family)